MRTTRGLVALAITFVATSSFVLSSPDSAYLYLQRASQLMFSSLKPFGLPGIGGFEEGLLSKRAQIDKSECCNDNSVECCEYVPLKRDLIPVAHGQSSMPLLQRAIATEPSKGEEERRSETPSTLATLQSRETSGVLVAKRSKTPEELIACCKDGIGPCCDEPFPPKNFMAVATIQTREVRRAETSGVLVAKRSKTPEELIPLTPCCNNGVGPCCDEPFPPKNFMAVATTQAREVRRAETSGALVAKRSNTPEELVSCCKNGVGPCCGEEPPPPQNFMAVATAQTREVRRAETPEPYSICCNEQTDECYEFPPPLPKFNKMPERRDVQLKEPQNGALMVRGGRPEKRQSTAAPQGLEVNRQVKRDSLDSRKRGPSTSSFAGLMTKDLVYPAKELGDRSPATDLTRRETLEPRLVPNPCCYPVMHKCCKKNARRGLELTTERQVPTAELESRLTDGKPSTDLILSKRDKLEPRLEVIPCCFQKTGSCCPPRRRFYEIADLVKRVAAHDVVRLRSSTGPAVKRDVDREDEEEKTSARRQDSGVPSAKDESQNTKRSSLQKRMLGADVQQESEYR
ncbi:hypothetical protein CBOM_03834 [Ceraceosorus bombacis]|uniref:Uncharacterized protein n=1 Tax=Ceraceosorus bombacis TaxID=401625 RepID=A0A0P1BH50_9BASI|nr:hypothetical protein CBOM_03834 [Ceraceosorus bombacis]